MHNVPELKVEYLKSIIYVNWLINKSSNCCSSISDPTSKNVKLSSLHSWIVNYTKEPSILLQYLLWNLSMWTQYECCSLSVSFSCILTCLQTFFHRSNFTSEGLMILASPFQYQPQLPNYLHTRQAISHYSPILLIHPNLWASSCVGQPCAGPSACLTCGTWRYRWAPVMRARRWSCSSCPCGASRSGCEPLCGGKKKKKSMQWLFSSSPHLAAINKNLKYLHK